MFEPPQRNIQLSNHNIFYMVTENNRKKWTMKTKKKCDFTFWKYDFPSMIQNICERNNKNKQCLAIAFNLSIIYDSFI